MTKALLNPKTNIVDNPIHPCYKAPEKGLCKMRTDGEVRFECAMEPKYCRYLKREEKKVEVQNPSPTKV